MDLGFDRSTRTLALMVIRGEDGEHASRCTGVWRQILARARVGRRGIPFSTHRDSVRDQFQSPPDQRSCGEWSRWQWSRGPRLSWTSPFWRQREAGGPSASLTSPIVPTVAAYHRRAAEAFTSEQSMLRCLRIHRIC